MPDSVHWRAIDSLDLKPDEWLTDPQKYVWSCRLEAEYMSGRGGWTAGHHGEGIHQSERRISTQACDVVLHNLHAERRGRHLGGKGS